MPRLFSGGLLACIAMLSGCSRQPLTVLVRGKITHDGKPLAGALVGFINSKDSGRAASGVTDADGNYSLITHFGGDQFIEGALPDDYAIIVQKVRAPNHRAVREKMRAIGKKDMAKLLHYMREQAMYDLWPDGVPEGWPAGYIPGVTMPPAMLKESPKARRLARLGNGLTLIPLRYSNAHDPCFHASVEPRGEEPLVFDFALFGKADDFNAPTDDSPAPPSEKEPRQQSASTGSETVVAADEASEPDR